MGAAAATPKEEEDFASLLQSETPSNGMSENRRTESISSSHSTPSSDRSYIFSDTDNKMTSRELPPATKLSARALSMNFMKSLSGICCRECGKDPLHLHVTDSSNDSSQSATSNRNNHSPSDWDNLKVLQHQSSSNGVISPLVLEPMTGFNLQSLQEPQNTNTLEGLIGEYMCLCRFYQVPYNAGIVATLRFSLPSLRVSGSFHDLDVMALVELLLRHANGRLRYIRRLDFTVASKEGKQQEKSSRTGFTSHGALALAKLLQTTKFIRQVWLQGHRIGPYGASAILLACNDNATIRDLDLRRCQIGERGSLSFCQLLTESSEKGLGLREVDLSSNGIGSQGTRAIENKVKEWNDQSTKKSFLMVNLEGNLVFPEIMNGVTHGFGIILSAIGGILLSRRVQDKSLTHVISCTVYTASLLVLYVSSTLYHSFFPLRNVQHIFKVMDKCAIYVLIAGSYTPFLTVMFADKPIYSVGLLAFIWICCFLGISVEALAPTWKRKGVFSLSMYLGMGWAAMVCLPETGTRLPINSIYLIIFGGVGYTAGVPFFIRDNNLDHAIWHLFVLSGSIFHWLAVYLYVAPTPL